MLTSQQANACQCPSCNYSNAAQNCQCCIYRQLGKRSDPALTFNLPVPSYAALFRYMAAPSAMANHVPQRATNTDRVDADDWSAQAGNNLYGAAREAYPVTSGLGDGPTLTKGVTGYGRFNQRMSLSRLFEIFNLANALQSAQSDSQY
ncbi:uncharacterized protein [Littorina saxatilis]